MWKPESPGWGFKTKNPELKEAKWGRGPPSTFVAETETSDYSSSSWTSGNSKTVNPLGFAFKVVGRGDFSFGGCALRGLTVTVNEPARGGLDGVPT